MGKLVRDKIPEIIKNDGKTPIVEVLSAEEYLIELDKKLNEEVAEYQADKSIEEMADVLEVLLAICEARGYSEEELIRVREDKREKRGGFKDRIYLLGNENSEAGVYMTWEEYNDKVWDWSISTAVNRLSKVESLGDSTEVAELINHFGVNDRKAADKLLKRALEEGLEFNVDGIFELKNACSPELFQEALDVSAKYFKKSDLEELYGFVDDEQLVKVAKQYNISLPEELEDQYGNVNDPITWKKFYENYAFWEEEYSKKRAQRLINYGKSEEEILEVLNHVFSDDEVAAGAFVKKILDRGIVFSAEALIEISNLCDEDMLKKAVMKSSYNFDANDLDVLYEYLEDELIIKVANKRHLPLPDALCAGFTASINPIREKKGYQYRPSECLALGLHPKDEVYEMYLKHKVLTGDEW